MVCVGFVPFPIFRFLGNAVDPTVPTRILCMVEGVMHKLPGNTFKQLAETILLFLSGNNPQLKCSACQCLYRMLQHQPSDTVLPVEVNAQLILALRDCAPYSGDIAVTAYWIQVRFVYDCSLLCLVTYKGRSSIPSLLTKSFRLWVKLMSALPQKIL